MKRLEVTKTFKLFINGQFPRTESGRSLALPARSGGVAAHVCHASRKDLRDAVVAARAAHEPWRRRSAYNRAQIIYRLAEMLEGKKQEFADSLRAVDLDPPPAAKTSRRAPKTARPRQSNATPETEVAGAIDRLVAYAGWADKYQQILGSNNPVQGRYYNFTAPEPTGLVALLAPDEFPLLALVSLLAPPLCAGNTIVALASDANPVPACILAEVIATSDVPPGVVNILTGQRAELVPHIAAHRDIDAIHAANLSPDHERALREGASENVKRVTIRTLAPAQWLDHDLCSTPAWIERFLEMKTIWHPAGA